MTVGRLAPTPSGALHLGNVAAFAAAWLSSRAVGGRVLLRIEDVDRQRARDVVADGQRRDLDWLGLAWDAEVPRQSERDYAPWLERLGGLYRCVCTRRDAKGSYSGTCRTAGHAEGSWRWTLPAGTVLFVDRCRGPQRVDPEVAFGDPIVRRADGLFTYALANVVDDLVDGVTEVVRGADLLDYSASQIRLWEALGATPPTWLHGPLILGPNGRKLSKSHGAVHVGDLRAAGWSQRDVWATVLPWLGLDVVGDIAQAVANFDATRLERGPWMWADPGARRRG